MRYTGLNGSDSKCASPGASRRSAGRRSRRVGTRAPTPVSGSSQPSSSPSFQRIAQRARTAREDPCDGSPEVIAWTSFGKSSGPPGVGSAHTSSRSKSGVSSWIRQGCEPCALAGSLTPLLRAPLRHAAKARLQRAGGGGVHPLAQQAVEAVRQLDVRVVAAVLEYVHS